MNFTMKLIENETGAPVPGVPDFQTDGGIMICRVERDGKPGWVTCGVNLGEVLEEAGSEMALAKALMSAAKETTKTGGETIGVGLNSRLILTCAELRTTSAPSVGKNSKHHQIIVSSVGQK